MTWPEPETDFEMSDLQTSRRQAVTGPSLPGLVEGYATLPDRFHVRALPEPVSAPTLIEFNEELARELRLDLNGFATDELAALFSGNAVSASSRPIAMAYAGHQFGNFVPQLGDGRAILLGEVTDIDGRRRDIQLKGSGQTVFSRGGDGRAAIGPVLREYIVSEAMAALGVPTTRSLAAVATGDSVYREQRLPGAILTRVAASHVRIGTFQYFAARGDMDGVKILADHVIARLYPALAQETDRYAALFAAVVNAQADLIARWMHLGFIHGVMNTDNMAISGETIDYGPCAFMDAYDPATVFSSIDQYGRYAFANQPPIGQWNLARFAETLLPLFSDDQDAAVERAQSILGAFKPRFEETFLKGMRAKLGLFTERDEDGALARGLFDTMAKGGADFTLTFRSLGDDVLTIADGAASGKTRALFSDPAAFDVWAALWRDRLAQEPSDASERRAAMNAVNPKFIPRNHRVEAVIAAAVDQGDYAPFEELLAVVTKPFDEQPDMAAYAEPPQLHERVMQTFCGT